MSQALYQLLAILNLETLEQNLFRGLSPQVGWQRVFGGQVIGQALVAAYRTIEDRAAHSLHAYFLRAGDPKVPIIYEVDRIRDGNSFSTRRVVAIQHGQAIFSMAASFHKHEEGLIHQAKMPDVPQPEALPSEAELKEHLVGRLPEPLKAYWQHERPIEIRPVDLSRYTSPHATGLHLVYHPFVQPIIDIHTHLYTPSFGTPSGGSSGNGDPKGLLLWGVDELVTYHYLVAEVYRIVPATVLPYEQFWKMSMVWTGSSRR